MPGLHLRLQSLLNFILPDQFTESLGDLRAIFKVKGDAKVSLLSQERISRAKKMMMPFVLRRRKDQVSYWPRIEIAKWNCLLPRSWRIYPQKRSALNGVTWRNFSARYIVTLFSVLGKQFLSHHPKTQTKALQNKRRKYGLPRVQKTKSRPRTVQTFSWIYEKQRHIPCCSALDSLMTFWLESQSNSWRNLASENVVLCLTTWWRICLSWQTLSSRPFVLPIRSAFRDHYGRMLTLK